jgi:hypothetical protein
MTNFLSYLTRLIQRIYRVVFALSVFCGAYVV